MLTTKKNSIKNKKILDKRPKYQVKKKNKRTVKINWK